MVSWMPGTAGREAKAGEAIENALSDLELVSPGKGEADVQSQQERLGCLCLPLAAKPGSTAQFSIPFSQRRLTPAFQKLQC